MALGAQTCHIYALVLQEALLPVMIGFSAAGFAGRSAVLAAGCLRACSSK